MRPAVPPQLGYRVVAYPLLWRIAAALFLLLSLASIPVIFWRVVAATDPPITPLLLYRMMLVLTLAPWLVVQAVRAMLAAELRIEPDSLVLLRRRLRM